MGLRRRLGAFCAGIGLIGGVLLSSAAPAGAAEHDGNCQDYELCLYYNSGYTGARHDFRLRVADFAPHRFAGPGAGAGSSVKNNAASAFNVDYHYTARIFYNSGYAGPADDIRPHSRRNLADTYNNNASMYWCDGDPLTCYS